MEGVEGTGTGRSKKGTDKFALLLCRAGRPDPIVLSLIPRRNESSKNALKLLDLSFREDALLKITREQLVNEDYGSFLEQDEIWLVSGTS